MRLWHLIIENLYLNIRKFRFEGYNIHFNIATTEFDKELCTVIMQSMSCIAVKSVFVYVYCRYEIENCSNDV